MTPIQHHRLQTRESRGDGDRVNFGASIAIRPRFNQFIIYITAATTTTTTRYVTQPAARLRVVTHPRKEVKVKIVRHQVATVSQFQVDEVL